MLKRGKKDRYEHFRQGEKKTIQFATISSSAGKKKELQTKDRLVFFQTFRNQARGEKTAADVSQQQIDKGEG